MRLPVYLDAPSTTPVDPRVFEAMRPYFMERFGNASSRQHLYGADAADAVASAREKVAALIACEAEEIVFTSGGTEAVNLALRGFAAANRAKGDHIVTTATEHRSAMDSCRRLENEGFRMTYVAVGEDGLVSPSAIEAALTPATRLVSVLLANHETGVVQPGADIGKICQTRGIAYHVNAVQAAAVLSLDVDLLGCDLLSLSAHKMYGPKGIGALFVRRRERRARVAPLLEGGGHERGLHPGALPVPLAAGFGEAALIALNERAADSSRIAALRDRLWAALRGAIPGSFLNGSETSRLPGILNVSFEGVEAESLLLALRQEVAASSGSGCTSDSPEPSYILLAMGLPAMRLPSSVRFGIGRFTSDNEVDFAAGSVARAVADLRKRSPLA